MVIAELSNIFCANASGVHQGHISCGVLTENKSTLYMYIEMVTPYDQEGHHAHVSPHLSPLTSEVVGAPQMTLQQYLSTLPCLPLPSGNLQTPFPSIPWCYLPISSSVFLSFLLLAMPEDLEIWPYQLSFLLFTMVRRSSCTPVAFWILLRTSSFVTWSL